MIVLIGSGIANIVLMPAYHSRPASSIHLNAYLIRSIWFASFWRKERLILTIQSSGSRWRAKSLSDRLEQFEVLQKNPKGYSR